MTLNKLFLKLKGGPGSGNFGHSGRPGKRGGSSPGGEFSAMNELKEGKRIRQKVNGSYENGKIVNITSTHFTVDWDKDFSFTYPKDSINTPVLSDIEIEE